MSRAFATQCVAALALSGCMSTARMSRLERTSSISPANAQTPTHSAQGVAQIPECHTTYDCCIQRHPLDPEVCAANPTHNPPKADPRNPPVPPLPLTGEKVEAKRPVNLNRCLDS